MQYFQGFPGHYEYEKRLIFNTAPEVSTPAPTNEPLAKRLDAYVKTLNDNPQISVAEAEHLKKDIIDNAHALTTQERERFRVALNSRIQLMQLMTNLPEPATLVSLTDARDHLDQLLKQASSKMTAESVGASVGRGAEQVYRYRADATKAAFQGHAQLWSGLSNRSPWFAALGGGLLVGGALALRKIKGWWRKIFYGAAAFLGIGCLSRFAADYVGTNRNNQSPSSPNQTPETIESLLQRINANPASIAPADAIQLFMERGGNMLDVRSTVQLSLAGTTYDLQFNASNRTFSIGQAPEMRNYRLPHGLTSLPLGRKNGRYDIGSLLNPRPANGNAFVDELTLKTIFDDLSQGRTVLPFSYRVNPSDANPSPTQGRITLALIQPL